MQTLLYECQDGNSKQAVRNGNHPTQKKMSGASGGSAAQTVSRGEELRQKYGTEDRANQIKLTGTNWTAKFKVRSNLQDSEKARKSTTSAAPSSATTKAINRRSRKIGKDITTVVSGTTLTGSAKRGGEKPKLSKAAARDLKSRQTKPKSTGKTTRKSSTVKTVKSKV